MEPSEAVARDSDNNSAETLQVVNDTFPRRIAIRDGICSLGYVYGGGLCCPFQGSDYDSKTDGA